MPPFKIPPRVPAHLLPPGVPTGMFDLVDQQGTAVGGVEAARARIAEFREGIETGF